jgi:hypothetical protein
MFPMQWVQGNFSPEENGWGMKSTTHLHLVPRLKTSGTIPLLVYALMVYTETTFPFTFYMKQCSKNLHCYVVFICGNRLNAAPC